MSTQLQEAANHLITTRFRKTIWRNFVSALKRYGMLSPGDCVGVCISGGKDSLLLALCMLLLQKYSEFPFEVRLLSMDPGYSEENREKIKRNIESLGLDVHFFNSDILAAAETSHSPCHICAAMRRGYLYKEARKLGCNKIALGHHFDDVCETVLLSIFYGGEFKTMMPRLNSANYEGMQLIRPLYLVREKYIVSWTQALNISCLTCSCAVTRRQEGGKRREIKNLLKSMETVQPKLLNNIFASTEAVNLQTVLGYRVSNGGPVQSVLDGIDNQTEKT